MSTATAWRVKTAKNKTTTKQKKSKWKSTCESKKMSNLLLIFFYFAFLHLFWLFLNVFCIIFCIFFFFLGGVLLFLENAPKMRNKCKKVHDTRKKCKKQNTIKLKAHKSFCFSICFSIFFFAFFVGSMDILKKPVHSRWATVCWVCQTLWCGVSYRRTVLGRLFQWH